MARPRAAIDFTSKNRPLTLLGQPLLSDAVTVGPRKLASRTPPRPPLLLQIVSVSTVKLVAAEEIDMIKFPFTQ